MATNQEERVRIYRGYIGQLACALYNDEEDWDKQAIGAFFHMGDPAQDYIFPDEPPITLTEEEFLDALDRIFERAGI